MESVSELKRPLRGKVMPVRVSHVTYKKVEQLNKILNYATTNYVWARDVNVLKCNLFLVPTSINYSVLLAMGRRGGMS